MSVKFWLVVTVLSVALAHTYVYTDLLSQGTPSASATDRNDFPGYMAAMQFSVADIWKQLKAELKLHLEVGQRTAVKVRRNIAEFRKRRAELKAKRDALSNYK